MKLIGKEIKENETVLLYEDINKTKLRKLEAERAEVHLVGGEKAIAKQHAKGKLTARERIEKLIDENTIFYELNTFAAYDMYKEYGGAPSSGTVFGIGRIQNRECVIVANDATVKA